MRDTWQLRSRLHAALAGLPLAVAVGCGPAAAPAEVQPAPSPAPAATPTPERPAAPAPPPWVSPYPARTGTDPFDPDGIEEEGCPNGDWCGAARVAEKLATQTATLELGCPTRLMGTTTPKGDVRQYKGISLNPMMQGRLRKLATAEKRAATGDDDQCCYHWFDYCSGRPLLDDAAESVRAPLQPGGTWLMGHVSEDRVAALPHAVRRALAGQWLDDARDEHASVAAFARATLELLAVGAPPELVFASQQASLDEIRHAQACFTIAALYADEPAEPGPLPAVGPRGGGLLALACNTFLEGCVGETVAALAALRAARGCKVAAIREALTGIADDETRHAELAWATLAFAVRNGGPEVAAAVRDLAAALADEPAEPTAASPIDEPTESLAALTHEPPASLATLAHEPAESLAALTHEPAELPAPVLAAHGRLTRAALAETRRDAWRDVIAPTLALILAGPSPAADTLLS